MSFLQNFISGSQAGTQARQSRERREIGGLAALGDYGGAMKKANEYGMTDIASQFQQDIAAMDKAQLERETQVANQMAQEALAIHSMTDPQAKNIAIANFGQAFGYSPEDIQQAQQNPELMMQVASGFGEYAKVLATNQSRFQLSEGQAMYNADGSPLAELGRTFAPQKIPDAILTDKYYAENPDALARAKDLKSAGRAQTNVNLPGPPTHEFGKVPEGFVAMQDPETGESYMKPVPGSPAAQSKQGEQRRIAEQTQKALEKIDRLLDPRDLRGGVRSAYGMSGTGWRAELFGRRPGSKGATAAAIIDEVIGPRVLDELSKMKGVPSDRDIELVKGAATALANPNIGDGEAIKQLEDMQAALQRIQSLPDVTSPSPGVEGMPPLPPGFVINE